MHCDCFYHVALNFIGCTCSLFSSLCNHMASLFYHSREILLSWSNYTASVPLRVHGLPFVCYRYYTDPSGTFWQCNAKAIGSGSEGADSSLQEQYNKVQYKINAKLINQYLYNSKETWYLPTNPSYIKAHTSQYMNWSFISVAVLLRIFKYAMKLGDFASLFHKRC